MFLSSTTGPFLRPDLPDSTAPRTEAVKTGRRPPPQAAQCGLDGREHGVTLNQVGSARFLSRHPIRKGWLIDLPPARLPPAALFACHNGRKSHLDANFSYRGTRAPNSETSQASRVALGPDSARLAAACTAVIAETHCTAALCCLAPARLSTRNDEMADAASLARRTVNLPLSVVKTPL